jgi:hypothetical protein
MSESPVKTNNQKPDSPNPLRSQLAGILSISPKQLRLMLNSGTGAFCFKHLSNTRKPIETPRQKYSKVIEKTQRWRLEW